MAGLIGQGYSYDNLSLDPALVAMQQLSAANATSFNNNLPAYQQQLYTQADNSARNDLANKMNDVKYQANKRGLLYSGLKQGAEAGLQGQAAGGLANQRANINNTTQGQANDMTSQAVGLGINNRLLQNQMNQANYQGNMGNWQEQQQGMSKLAKGAGLLAGGIAGSPI
jgi:hypothetical protein